MNKIAGRGEMRVSEALKSGAPFVADGPVDSCCELLRYALRYGRAAWIVCICGDIATIFIDGGRPV